MSHHWRRNHYGQIPSADSATTAGYVPTSYPSWSSHGATAQQTHHPFLIWDHRLESLPQQLNELQRQLEATKRSLSQQANANQQQTANHETARRQWETTRAELQHRIEQLVEKANAGQALTREVSQLRSALASLQNDLTSKTKQIESLKTELQNAAITANDEQAKLQHQHRLDLERVQSEANQKDTLIERLKNRALTLSQERSDWESAHQSAISLADWLARELEKFKQDNNELREQFDRHRKNTSEAAAVFESEYETLEATIAMLRTDHESVEILCDDLVHLCSYGEMHQADLRAALEERTKHNDEERDESVRSLKALSEQLHQAQARLETTTEEKQSLIQSLAEFRRNECDSDAALFAKDQELDATQKLVDDTHRQLESLRRKYDAANSQNEILRNQNRDAVSTIADLESRLQDMIAGRDQLQETLDEKANLMKEIQTSARSAEANAIFRLSETEASFAIQRESLEEELEQLQKEVLNSQTETRQRVEDATNELKTHVLRLESELADARSELQQRDRQIAEVGQNQGTNQECQRLSRELARRISSHAKERESLLNRIEQLRERESEQRAA